MFGFCKLIFKVKKNKLTFSLVSFGGSGMFVRLLGGPFLAGFSTFGDADSSSVCEPWKRHCTILEFLFGKLGIFLTE